MSNLYEWFHDDITWCGNECSHIECERNQANRLQKTGVFSMSLFKWTETCPYYKPEEKNEDYEQVSKETCKTQNICDGCEYAKYNDHWNRKFCYAPGECIKE